MYALFNVVFRIDCAMLQVEDENLCMVTKNALLRQKCEMQEDQLERQQQQLLHLEQTVSRLFSLAIDMAAKAHFAAL